MRDPAIVVQSRVVGALILRDVQTRFGANPANYLFAVAWPLSHLAILLTIYTVLGRVAPYGTSTMQFFGTGVLPYIVFNYPSRFIMTSVMMNRPLLGFPIVSLFDIVCARAILEVITSCAVMAIFAAALYSAGVDIVPVDPGQAVAALATTLTMAVGFGIINALIASKVMAWNLVYIFFLIVMYILSGIVFIPDALPEFWRDILAWNPLLQAVSWFRSSYYPGYGELHLDRFYFVLVALLILTFSLVLERFSRRWLLQS